MALSTVKRGGLSFYRVGVNAGILLEPSDKSVHALHPTTGAPMVGCCQPTAVRNIDRGGCAGNRGDKKIGAATNNTVGIRIMYPVTGNLLALMTERNPKAKCLLSERTYCPFHLL